MAHSETSHLRGTGCLRELDNKEGKEDWGLMNPVLHTDRIVLIQICEVTMQYKVKGL